MSAPVSFRPDRRGCRRGWALLLGLALARPARADATHLQLGASYGALRERSRRGIASVEVDHRPDGWPVGIWGAVEVAPGAGQYVGVGPFLAWSPTPAWVLAGGSGPGYYHRQSGLELGYQLEFRSTFYLAHRLGRTGWAGASISHYSNAHLRSSNPGAETVRLFWSFPVSWW